ncbi:fructose-bisphosphatase class II, partial [Klebsiella pneumoniae]|uniref:fructose-bisphosphatase class II n=1 Tax=Klebsiella pneumoniae TaxID=573 RepID=UPI001F42A5D7
NRSSEHTYSAGRAATTGRTGAVFNLQPPGCRGSHHVKGDNEENRRIGENELARCKTMGIEAGKVLRLDEMARSDNVVFSATGITKGDLLDGITRKGNMATTETLLIRGKSRTIRRIQSIHYLDRKDPDIQQHIL